MDQRPTAMQRAWSLWGQAHRTPGQSARFAGVVISARLPPALPELAELVLAADTTRGNVSERADMPVREMVSAPAQKFSRTFPARPDQVRYARAFIGRALADAPMAEDAVLICSELCSNAILHSGSSRPGGQFTVRAEIHSGDYAWIEVQDEGGAWAPGERSDEYGHGLEIVSALADSWEIDRDHAATVVCARLDWPGAARDGT
jgi:anti-sigma regulatory factor (Ser/Thr protein kinase)